MKQYFLSQFKRGLRVLPGLILVAALLFTCLFVAFSAFSAQNEEEATTRFQIGMVGVVEGSYMDLAVAALQMMDATRFSMEIVQMDIASADDALRRGDITAYVVIPEGFMEAAFRGQMIPIEFVSVANATSFTTFIKEEISQIVSDIVLSSQKGSFGVGNALISSGNGHLAGKHTEDISIDYVRYVLDRGKVYKASALGISGELSLSQYLLCGLSVLFLLLCALPFAPFLIKKDLSLEQILWTRGCTPLGQILCQYTVFFLFLLIPAEFILLVFSQTKPLAPTVFLTALPSFFALSAMSFFLFSLSRDYIGGVLLPFFVSICLSFVSGCMYPVYFFPIFLQKVSSYLPTALARTQLSACLTGKVLPQTSLLLLLYTAVFLALSVLTRRRKLQGGAL